MTSHYTSSIVTDLESEAELFERAANLIGQRVHALALLEGDDGVGRAVLGRYLRHQLQHVELVGQLLQHLSQCLCDLHHRGQHTNM